MRKAIAIAVSDIHLTEKRPTCRADDDWFDSMLSSLSQVETAAHTLGVPILCGGDVFDNPHGDANKYTGLTLVNWALNHMPIMFSIPGQHDLISHRMDHIECSAYETLCSKGVLCDVSGFHYNTQDFVVYGLPYGAELPEPPKTDKLTIALVHDYIWDNRKHAFVNAPFASMMNKRDHKGWDFVVYGDNHSPFFGQSGCTTVVNCGSLARQKSNNEHKPSYWVLHDDMSVERVHLDTSLEKMVTPEEKKHVTIAQSMKDIEAKTADFEGIVRQQAKKLRLEVGKIMLDSITKGKE
jgi:hypothetical protein